MHMAALSSETILRLLPRQSKRNLTVSLHYRSLWEDLKHCKVPLMLVVGEKDEKFKKVAQKMWHEIDRNTTDRDDAASKPHQMVVVPSCGHAVHLENPLPVIQLVRQFVTNLTRKKTCRRDDLSS
ncbi:hypothetical protein V6N13_135313 [Hibiscus sabdariffa]